MCQRALGLAADGFWVFRVKAGDSKEPLARGWQREATREPGALWRDSPKANIGIFTGKYGAGDKALVVVDFDPRNSGGKTLNEMRAEMEAAHGPLPPTLVVNTPSGGQHWYYTVGTPLRGGSGKLGPGIDIKSDRGYVLGPGSARSDGAYTIEGGRRAPAPAPAWLAGRLSAPKHPKVQEPIGEPDPDWAHNAALNYLAARPAAVKGQRNARAFEAAAKLRDFGVALDAAQEMMAAHWRSEPPLPAAELRTAVANAWNYAQNAAASANPAAMFEVLPETAGASNHPAIKIRGGDLPRMVDEAESALVAARGLYQRGSFIVRPAVADIATFHDKSTRGHRLVPVRLNHMRETLTAAACWQRYDARSKAWRPVDCPADVAATYLEREGRWKLPVLAGLINAPTLRPDGSVLDTPGYDAATGFLYDPLGLEFPPVPGAPGKSEARASLDILAELIASFPFVGGADRSVALSAILTALVRPSLPTAPMHAFDAPGAGAGKSLLVDIASMIATGRRAAVISQGRNEEEFEKRLGAALLAGDTLIAIDNCDQPLGGERLCQVLTQQSVKVRILGRSEMPELPSVALIAATGNNLALAGDLSRRALLCSLDPRCERPELRAFPWNPLDRIQAARPGYVAAGLTMLRAYQVAGTRVDVSPFGSFEAWSRTVRETLVWLGEADPCETIEKVRESDPRRAAHAAVMEAWEQVLGEQPVTTRQIIGAALGAIDGKPADFGSIQERDTTCQDFREALLVVAGVGKAINSQKLGTWLRSAKGRIVGARRLICEGVTHGAPRWRLLKGPAR
jgi:hypothetical protein